MGGLVCAVHRRKNKGFPTLKRTLNLGIEKGRLLKNSRPKGGLIQVICYPASPETVDITGFFEKFCIAIRTKTEQAIRLAPFFLSVFSGAARIRAAGLGPKCRRCRWASASFCRFAAALARGNRAFLSAKQAESGSSGEFQIPPVFFMRQMRFLRKTCASSAFKAARGFPPRLYPALPWASPSGFCPARR